MILWAILIFYISMILILRFVSIIKYKYYSDNTESISFINFFPKIKNQFLNKLLNYFVFLGFQSFFINRLSIHNYPTYKISGKNILEKLLVYFILTTLLIIIIVVHY